MSFFDRLRLEHGPAVVVVAAIGCVPRWAASRWPTVVLMALIYPAVLFTLRLKYREFIVLRTFCPWCAVNAGVVVLSVVLVWRDWVRLQALGPRARGGGAGADAGYAFTPGRRESRTA